MAIAKLKLDLDAGGGGKITLDGVELECVTAISFKAAAGTLNEVTLTILAEIDASIEARLDQIALKKLKPEVRTVRTADGRELPVRSRTPN